MRGPSLIRDLPPDIPQHKELCRQLGTSAFPSRSSQTKGTTRSERMAFFSVLYYGSPKAKATMKSPRTDHWLHSNSQQGLCLPVSNWRPTYQTAIIHHLSPLETHSCTRLAGILLSLPLMPNGDEHRNKPPVIFSSTTGSRRPFRFSTYQ